MIRLSLTLLAATLLNCHFSLAQQSIPLIYSDSLIQQGIKLHDEGKYREAIEVYSRIMPGDSNYVTSLYEQALAYKADSQYAKAIEYCEQALKVKQEFGLHPRIYSVYGSTIDVMGNPERAHRIFDSALAMYPEFDELYSNKAITLIRADRFAEAEKILQPALLRSPFYHSFHYLNGVCAFYQGHPVEAFLSFSAYLLIAPNGVYKSKAISMMSSIAKNENHVIEYVSNRKKEPADAFLVIEQIIASKIALEKGYKPIISLDDQVCRQMQVMLEKLEYNENEPDFYMQYYVPFFTSVFADRKFEPLVFRTFAGVDIEAIQKYHTKNKKELEAIVDRTSTYFTNIRNTRTLQATKRSGANYLYYFEGGNITHHGPVNGTSNEGKWTYIYPAGNLRSEGMRNSNNERDGVWKYYYIDGTPDGTEAFSNGKLNGPAEYFHKNGQPLMRGTYVNGERHGKFTFYNKMGGISDSEEYENGKVHGMKYSYYPSGALKLKEEFTNGQSNGKFFTYYESGAIQKEGVSVNNELNGTYKYYHENGTLSIEGVYEKGKQQGAWKHYHANGKPKAVENFVNGVLEGEYIEYHNNGQPLSSPYKFKKGKTNGEVNFYTDEGILYCTMMFDDGVIKWAKQFDKTGKQIDIMELKQKKLDITFYTQDGFIRLLKPYNDKGVVHGTEIAYYPSGAKKESNEYRDGVAEGLSINWHTNGQKNAEINMQDGEKHGYFTLHHYNGFKLQEGWYQQNLAQGIWKFYNNQGDLSSIANYLNDHYHGSLTTYWPGNVKASETGYDEGVKQSITQYDTLGKVINVVNFKAGSGKYTALGVTGKKLVEGTYKNNELEGEYRKFFADGKTNSITYYRNGMADSVYREYFLNGKLSEEGKYVAGKKSGTWTNYSREGKLYSTEEFKDGELHGISTYFHPNGNKRIEIHYEDDNQDGHTSYYSFSGTVMVRMRFKDGDLLSYSYLGKDGKYVPEIPLPGGTGKIEAFYPNGTKSISLEFRDHLAEGVEKFYNESGKLVKQVSREVGRISDYKTFYEDGTPEAVFAYKNGVLHGPFKEYHPNGKLKTEGYNYDGEDHGTVNSYDANGKKTLSVTYYHGQMLDVKK